MISPVTVLAAGEKNRTIYKTDLRNLRNLDVLFRRLFRSSVGFPALMDWTRPWHEILHDWNGRVNEFAAFMASSDGQNDVSSHMWIRGGGPTHFWHTVFTNVCRWKGLQHSVWSQKLTNAEWKCCLVSFIA